MSAIVYKGREFVTGETVTPAKLHALVDDASLLDIEDTDLSGLALFKLLDSEATTDGDISVEQGDFRVRFNSRHNDLGGIYYFKATQRAISAGYALSYDMANQPDGVDEAGRAGTNACVGVAEEAASLNDYFRVRCKGIVPYVHAVINPSSTVTAVPGDFVRGAEVGAGESNGSLYIWDESSENDNLVVGQVLTYLRPLLTLSNDSDGIVRLF